MYKAEWLFQFQAVDFSYINVFKFCPYILAQKCNVIDFLLHFLSNRIRGMKNDQTWWSTIINSDE